MSEAEPLAPPPVPEKTTQTVEPGFDASEELRALQDNVDERVISFFKKLYPHMDFSNYRTDFKVFRSALHLTKKKYPEIAILIIDKAHDLFVNNFELALELLPFYYNRPYAEQAIRNFARRSQWGSFAFLDINRFLHQHKKYISSDLLEELMPILVKKEPIGAMQTFVKWKDCVSKDTAEKIKKMAISWFVEDRFFYDLKYLNNFEDKWARGIAKIVMSDFPLFFDNYEKQEEIFSRFPELKKYWESTKGNMKIMERGFDLPEQIIRAEDLPLKQKIFNLYLNGINYQSYSINREMYNERGLSGRTMISIPMVYFKEIFFSDPFQDILKSQAGKMTYMNAISLAQQSYRYIWKKQLKMNNENIKLSAKLILNEWEKVRSRELFGPDTNLISFTHEEDIFSNDKILQNIYFRSGGKKENILTNKKGIKMMDSETINTEVKAWHKEHGGKVKKEYLNKLLAGKDKFNLTKIMSLYSIANAKGATTILFSGHGGRVKWYFTQNVGKKTEPHMVISHRELGDALAENGNIRQFNLLGMCCYSFDFIKNLFDYLTKGKGINEKPHISISSANKSKFGFGDIAVHGSKFLSTLLESIGFGTKTGDLLLNAMYTSSEEGKPITVDHFFKAEGKVAYFEDPEIFIDIPELYKKEPVIGGLE